MQLSLRPMSIWSLFNFLIWNFVNSNRQISKIPVFKFPSFIKWTRFEYPSCTTWPDLQIPREKALKYIPLCIDSSGQNALKFKL